MITITVELVGVDHAQRVITHIDQGVSDLKPLWKDFGDERRAEQGRLFGLAPWTPLKTSTEAQKARRFGGPSRILVASGRLLRSFTLTEGDQPGDVINRIDDLQAEFGSAVPYGIYHHEGRGHLPVRELLAEPDEDRYATIAGEYLMEVVEKAA